MRAAARAPVARSPVEQSAQGWPAKRFRVVKGGDIMRRFFKRMLLFLSTPSLLVALASIAAADPEIDRLLRGPIGKDWVTNGGNLTNQR